MQKDDNFISRLRKCAEIVGSANALSRAAGVSQSGLSRYFEGGEPSRPILIAIAKAAGVSLDWLATGEGSMTRQEVTSTPVASPQPASLMDEFVLVPRYDVRVSAGGGCLVDRESVLDHYAFRRDWLTRLGVQKNKLAMFVVRGDSMEPTLRDEDLVLVNLRDRKINEDAIYILRADDVLLAKRVQRLLDGSLIVKSDNPTYREQVIPPEQTEGVCIIGRVVWSGRKM